MSVSECRFCAGKRILKVDAQCDTNFRGQMPGKAWSDGYNFVPGLMVEGNGNRVTFDVCLGCQRVQTDLFEYKPNKNTWPLDKKLDDLRERAMRLISDIDDRRSYLTGIVGSLGEVDRCLVGLVRDLEGAKAQNA